MSDYQAARKNMVDCQIHPAGVINEGILEAFSTIPRELFVSEKYKNMAYNDEDIPLAEGRYLLEPSVYARMIQALDLKPDSVVIEVGGATGYGAAILSSLVSAVVVLESDKKLIRHAKKIWDELDLFNIASVEGDITKGNPEHAPYDSILMKGAVHEVPQDILEQLAPGGRLICVVKKPGEVMGEVRLFENTGDGSYPSYSVFSAGTPYLHGFEPKPEFQF